MLLTRSQLDTVVRKRWPGYALAATLPPSIQLDFEVRAGVGQTYEVVFLHLSDNGYLVDMTDGHAPLKTCVARIYPEGPSGYAMWTRRTNPGSKGAIRYQSFKTQDAAIADALRWAKRRFRTVVLAPVDAQ